MKTRIIFLLIALIATTSQAQVLSSFVQPDGSYDFRGDTTAHLKPDSVFIQYKDSFDLGAMDTVKIISNQVDPENDTKRYYKYQQYYKGYRVENAEYAASAV